jgi:hypothetical protein
MARIRSAKPEFWTDPVMCSLPRDVRFTFKGLWEVSADDYGRFLADARMVKSQVWPLDDDITTKKVDGWLTILASLGRIQLYEVHGVRYGAIVNWSKHQRVSHPSPSRFPTPPDDFRNDSGAIPETLAKSSALSGSGAERDIEGNGKRSGAEATSYLPDPDPLDLEQPAAPPAPLVVLPDAAERFVQELYGLATEKRRLDVRRQLYDALDPTKRGARLSRGTFVRARDAAHLAECCEAIRLDPPRDVDASVVVLLKKLQDPPKGPSPTEVAAEAEQKRVAEEERYHAAAKRAGIRWAHEHPEAYADLRREVDAKYHDAIGSSFGRLARDSELAQRCAERAGFPAFDAWQADDERQREARMTENGVKLVTMRSGLRQDEAASA